MKPIWKNLISLAVFIAFVVAGLVVATLIPLKGANFWILVGVFAALGLIGAGALLWWWRSQPAPAAEQGIAAGQTAEQEIEFLIRKAEERLRASRLGRNATIGKLPLVLLVGETGAGKTSAILNSGLEPELLAGQASQDGKVTATRSVNVWFGGEAVFADASGSLLTQPAAWSRLVRRLTPSGVSSVFARKGPATRVAIVCMSCESFLRPGAAEANANSVRALRSSLEECSRRLGVNLPVYVLFTNFDRVPFFADYVENFLPEEAMQVFGATLPALSGVGAGIFAEEETKRLTAAFDELFYRLSDGRTEFLARENKAERLPGAYEFPREFRKLRAPLVQFLVDLARPSQLTTGPALRGFYFAGRRTVLVEAEAPAEISRPVAAAAEEDMGATRVMTSAQIQRLAAQRSGALGAAATHVFDLRGAAGGRTRQEEQPVFLTRLLSTIVLKDRAGIAASGSRAKVNLWRRLLLGAVAVICLIFAAGFVVSFVGNRALKNRVDAAAQAAQASPANAPLGSDLQQLENLRRPLATLGNYNMNGEPASLAWWLYTGHRLYPIACSAYSQKFRQVLLGPTQSSLVSFLRGLPSTPTGDYGTAYDALRAYLITTTNPAESRQAFLTPELFKTWSAGRSLDAGDAQLAQTQLDFYSQALQNQARLGDASCFASTPDQDAIAHARAYLNLFPPEERVYRAMLADASKNAAPVIYAREFPNSAGIVADPFEVSGAFTKEGWAVMQKDLANPQPFLKGEPWVLGTQVSDATDVITLEQHLRQRYEADSAGAWRQYLSSARVLPYKNLGDAASKLAILSGNASPLLELFWLAAHHVSGGPLATEFQPVLKVVPGTAPNVFVGPSNQPYMAALVGLQGAVTQAAGQPPTIASGVDPTAAPAAQATSAAMTLAQAFTPDPSAHVDSIVQKLMLEPILNVQSAKPKPGEALNGAGRTLCAQMRPIFSQFPFNPRSETAASPAQFAALFQPTGALSNFYTQNLASVLTFGGSEYVPNPASAIRLYSPFLLFFNRATALGRALYSGGAAQPQLRFLLSPLPPQGVKQFSIVVDGQTMAYPGGAAQMVWSPLTASDAKRIVDGGAVDYQGPWAVFKLFGEAAWKPAGSGYDLTWVQRSGNQILRLPNGQPETSGVHLDMMGAPPVFEPGYLSRLGCVSRVAE